jgi:hypothetical protein
MPIRAWACDSAARTQSRKGTSQSSRAAAESLPRIAGTARCVVPWSLIWFVRLSGSYRRVLAIQEIRLQSQAPLEILSAAARPIPLRHRACADSRLRAAGGPSTPRGSSFGYCWKVFGRAPVRMTFLLVGMITLLLVGRTWSQSLIRSGWPGPDRGGRRGGLAASRR